MATQRQSDTLPAGNSQPGKVFLVGAGPGDAGLITWRGVQCLQQADWVLYDYLVNPAILRHVSPACQLICLGGHRKTGVGNPGSGVTNPSSDDQRLRFSRDAQGSGESTTVGSGEWGMGNETETFSRDAQRSAESLSPLPHNSGSRRIWRQSEINDALIQLARAGLHVVRLKGGDPAIFGRLAEEVAALEAAGIEYEIVPGITVAQAAGTYAGVWITQRDVASAMALVTGHEGDSSDPPTLDYAALAAFPGTLVFYMGVTTARQWTTALIGAGKPADTPAMIVRRCSWPDQTAIGCTLGTIAQELEAAKMRPPVVIIVGNVTSATHSPFPIPHSPLPQKSDIPSPSHPDTQTPSHPATQSWFTRRPLFGQRIVLTRPIDRTDSLWQPLAELGAECLLQPAIEISPPNDWQPVDAALARLSEFDWLVFSSVNGVQYLLDRLLATGADLRRLAGVKLAAIGPGTAEELAKYHLHVDGQPAEVYRAEALAELLAKDARGKRFLLARASRGREVLAETLRAAGGHVEQIVTYLSSDVAQPDPEIAAAMQTGAIDWITITSSAIARSVAKMFGDDLRQTKIVSISPVTSATLRELGFEPAAEAATYTMRGVVEAILSSSQAGI